MPRAADCDQPWRHEPATWLGDLAALLGLAAVLATVAVLRRSDRAGPAGTRRVGPLR